MTLPITVEYSVQNEFNEGPAAWSDRIKGLDRCLDSDPNVFILPKKYPSLEAVRLSEVIEAFPLKECE